MSPRVLVRRRERTGDGIPVRRTLRRASLRAGNVSAGKHAAFRVARARDAAHDDRVRDRPGGNGRLRARTRFLSGRLRLGQSRPRPGSASASSTFAPARLLAGRTWRFAPVGERGGRRHEAPRPPRAPRRRRESPRPRPPFFRNASSETETRAYPLVHQGQHDARQRAEVRAKLDRLPVRAFNSTARFITFDSSPPASENRSSKPSGSSASSSVYSRRV